MAFRKTKQTASSNEAVCFLIRAFLIPTLPKFREYFQDQISIISDVNLFIFLNFIRGSTCECEFQSNKSNTCRHTGCNKDRNF